MGGKSTILRQTCIAIIMAQLGCYVPARRCRMTPVDRIFTRIGANDNILAGQSTFMVELQETSKILQHATPHSLVILDELGRGTSTFDGYAIAYAVLHYLISHSGCMGLFSTHYHLLCKEFEDNPLLSRFHMACVVDDVNKQVTFLYTLVSGVCPQSYGMNVARLAGVPDAIVQRAEVVARDFEKTHGLDERVIGNHGRGALKLSRLADFALLGHLLKNHAETNSRRLFDLLQRAQP
jgi:DNA mismatch repair protein MSH6